MLFRSLVAVEYYFKVPEELEERPVIVTDPMLATANSSIAAVQRIKEAGARDIKFVCLLAAPEGLEAFQAAHPDVPIFTAAVDERLKEAKDGACRHVLVSQRSKCPVWCVA